MVQISRKWVVAAIGAVSLSGLTVLAGCSQQQVATPPSGVTETTQAPGTDVSGLTAVVAKTRTAVEANNFTAAKTEFEQFETAWKPIEDSIKAKAPDQYDRIEVSMDKISGGLRASQPNSTELLARLKELDQTIQTVVQ